MSWKANVVCVILGGMSVLAFAPFEIYPLVFIAVAGLAFLARNAKPKLAMQLGFCFGLGMYLFGVSWVYVSLSTYGGMPLWMGSISVLGFAGLLALFPAASLALSSLLANYTKRSFLFIFPFTWVIFEWSKSWFLTGFPWLDLAYTQSSSWLFAWAPIGGVYLVSFILVSIAVLCVQMVLSRSLKIGLVLVLIVGMSCLLNEVHWTRPIGKPVKIGVVQANIGIEGKWLAENQNRTIARYQTLTQELIESQSLDLIVWPETALPLYLGQTNTAFWQSVAPEGTALLTGLLDHDEHKSFNAAALSCADQREAPQVYRKRHLVPFGEYQPLKFLFSWVYDYLNLPMSDFSGWQGQQPLTCGERLNIGLSICYEDAFSNEYKNHLGDASILINISEDAWFGDSFAPHQRRQLAQMRAKELGRPLVRAANSGPSLFINSHGETQVATAQFKEAVAQKNVQAMQGRTPFMVFGSWIVWLSGLVLLVSFLMQLVINLKKARH